MADQEEVDYNNEEEYTGGRGEEDDEDAEEMMRRMNEMDDELQQLSSAQEEVAGKLGSAGENLDENSIYIGQVDYEANAEELRAHFAPCGTINRIKIMTNPVTGRGKGFAYMEFEDKEAVENALKLDDTTFKGRQLKVTPKRQNISAVERGVSTGRGRGGGRGRGFSPGRGRGRGGYDGGYGGRGGGGFRGGGRGGGRGRFSSRGGRGRGYSSNPY